MLVTWLASVVIHGLVLVVLFFEGVNACCGDAVVDDDDVAIVL